MLLLRAIINVVMGKMGNIYSKYCRVPTKNLHNIERKDHKSLLENLIINFRWAKTWTSIETSMAKKTHSIVSCSTKDTSLSDLCIMILVLSRVCAAGCLLFRRGLQ